MKQDRDSELPPIGDEPKSNEMHRRKHDVQHDAHAPRHHCFAHPALTLPGYVPGSFHAWYEPSVRSDGANSARCISARAQRRSSRFAATSA